MVVLLNNLDMKEQLTLERVAIYLPYGLECIYGGHGHDKKVKIIGLHTNEDEETYDYTFIDKMGDVDSDVFGWIKLILHPLSDLTKEIEVNGQKFVPIDELFIMFGGGVADAAKSYWKTNFIDNILYSPIGTLPFELVLILSKWHFDIHGLISKGLAIDINTL